MLLIYAEPPVGDLMIDMHGIEESDKNIHVQQANTHVSISQRVHNVDIGFDIGVLGSEHSNSIARF